MLTAANFPSPDLLLSAIIESSDDAIISKDLHGIITSWNPSAERMFGYSAEEMVGQPVSRLFPPDRLDEEPRILAQLQRGERVDHFETVRVRKDGTQMDVSLTISPIRNAEGKVVGASKIARNVTEQKQARRKLAEVHEELQRADRLKAEFISTLSHELRTPLTAILGWIQILKDDPGADDLAQGLEVIERNVHSQSQLIEDLLDISRIEAGKVPLDLQRVDLAAVASTSITSARPSAEAKGLRLTTAFSTLGAVVMGDSNRLQQIIWNLLTNAIKFTPKGGRVHVAVQRVESHVELSVNDSGQGIAREFLGQVFDRFRQGDASTTRHHGGLGLGLSIARHLTELHGGCLRAASLGAGHGATFTMALPFAADFVRPATVDLARRPDAIVERAANRDLSGVRVLAVDDDPDCLAVIRRILERAGAEVQTARSMGEALPEIARSTPHVILSDIGMPDHDGYEFIRRVREMPGGRGIPAVALTALARTEDRTRALRAGFQLHIAKPVDGVELVAVVQNLATLRANAA